jgi:hypothetical protein
LHLLAWSNDFFFLRFCNLKCSAGDFFQKT